MPRHGLTAFEYIKVLSS